MNRPLAPEERRVLVLLPDDRAARITADLVEAAGETPLRCADMAALAAAVPHGAGALLMMEETLFRREQALLLQTLLDQQPSWSDLPVLVVSASGADSPAAQWAERGLRNVTLLERPVRIRVLLSALRSAIAGRQRQYQLRDQIEALRASEQRERARVAELESVMRAAPMAIWIAHDPECKVITGNPASYALIHAHDGDNVSASAPVAGARGFREYRAGVALAPDALPLQRAAARGEEVVGEEITFRFDDGTERHIFGNAVPLRRDDGVVAGAVGAFLDITPLKLSQAMLQRRTAGLRLLADAAAIVLAEDDPDGMVNALFDRIAAHAGVDVYAAYTAEPGTRTLRMAASRGFDVHESAALATIAYGEAVCGQVAERGVPVVATDVQSSGEPMVQWLKSAGIGAYVSYPLIANGRLLGTLSFGTRGRPQLAPDDLEFLGTLARYATLARERARLIEELRESDRRKDEFLATLAHELRNPLAPMRNGLQIMKSAGPAPPTAEYARAVIERQLLQMVRLVDDLLDVSRVSAGKLKLQREHVAISKIITAAVDTARPAIDAGGHALELDIPAELLRVHADPLRLAQVFTNLLNNAAKYAERTGRITVTVRVRGDDVEVSIADEGLGIAADALARIFEPFAQVDHSLERTRGGLGIGLTLAKRIVELHGGVIEAHSEGVGRGSEFVVRVPLSLQARGEDAPHPSIYRAEVRPLRIVVADDNHDAAKTLGTILRMGGHEVRVVHDGASAVLEAARMQPDVAILDIGMPEMNGYDAAARIRAQERSRHTVLAALTGWGQDHDRQRARAAGFDHHFTKPVDVAALETMLAGIAPRPGGPAPLAEAAIRATER